MTKKYASDLDRFMAKVAKADNDNGCWEWTAGRLRGGYGHFRVGPTHKVAHRVAYELLVGPIPEGLQLDHLCRNRGCVNPAHLEPVTQRENILRGEGLAAQCARRETCVNGHLFTSRTGKRKQRVCRTCRREAYRRWYDRHVRKAC